MVCVSITLVLIKLAPKIDYITFLLPFLPDSLHICKRVVVFKYAILTQKAVCCLYGVLRFFLIEIAGLHGEYSVTMGEWISLKCGGSTT